MSVGVIKRTLCFGGGSSVGPAHLELTSSPVGDRLIAAWLFNLKEDLHSAPDC